MGEVFRFIAWAVAIVLAVDFIYSAFNKGRHLNHAFKPWRKKRP